MIASGVIEDCVNVCTETMCAMWTSVDLSIVMGSLTQSFMGVLWCCC